MLKAGKKIAEEKGLKINFIQGDVLEGLPFDDNYFDLVYSNSMIEFFKSEKMAKKALSEMWRILKPRGKFVIGVLNEDSTWAYKRTVETLKKDTIFSEGKFYKWNELKELMQYFGDVKIETTLFVPPYFENKNDFEWFKNLESEFKNRYPKRGALIVASVVKREEN
ncbi:MAG: class I SAM-dependent methyltransferase [Halanaerobiales bacterium]|nr:class I SAM-dependent methyltransferase [Halanaerobiales bacterium]